MKKNFLVLLMLANMVVISAAENELVVGMAVQKGNSVLLKEINEFIKTAKSDGTFDKIRDTYLLEETKNLKKKQE